MTVPYGRKVAGATIVTFLRHFATPIARLPANTITSPRAATIDPTARSARPGWDDAEKAERLVGDGSELVTVAGRDVDDVADGDLVLALTEQHRAAAPHDRNAVIVRVLVERRGGAGATSK